MENAKTVSEKEFLFLIELVKKSTKRWLHARPIMKLMKFQSFSKPF